MRNDIAMSDLTTIEANYAQVWNETRGLAAGLGAPESEAAVKALQDRLKLDSAELGKLSAETVKNGANPNEKQAVETVKGKVEALAALLGAIQTCNSTFKDNRKAHFQEAGNWARHYSTVRMTVLTFTLTTCAALLAWKWQADLRPIWQISGLWLLGVLTFWTFTYHTYDRLGSQMKYRPLLPAKLNEKPATVHLDWACLVVPAVNLGVMMFVLSEGVSVPDPWRSLWTGFTVLGVLVPFGIWLKVKRSRLFSAENRQSALLALAGIVVAGVLAYLFLFAGFILSCVVFPFAIWRKLRRGKRRSE